MSLGDADAKFPGQRGNAIPPSPTRENPGQVYPKSSPAPADPQDVPGAGRAPSNPRAVFSNPFAFDASLGKLEGALDEVIVAIGDEGRSGSSGEEVALLQKFRGWRSELDKIRGSRGTGEPRSKADSDAALGETQEGGLFTD